MINVDQMLVLLLKPALNIAKSPSLWLGIVKGILRVINSGGSLGNVGIYSVGNIVLCFSLKNYIINLKFTC